MKNLLTAAFVCLLFAGTANSQSFPILHAQNLQDKDVTLPDYVKGKRAVICMAFSMKADESLKKWTQPLYNHLLADGMGGYNAGEVASEMACEFVRRELGLWLQDCAAEASDTAR